MEHSGTKKLAKVLKVLVTVTFVCNLMALPLVPGLAGVGTEGGWDFLSPSLFFPVCWQYLTRVWRDPYPAVLTVFLLFCGANTAVILWQARRVLGTVIDGLPFQRANARSMRRAAVCFGLISLAALIRLVWELVYFDSVTPIFTYNALFVPIFAMGCLLCLVMSALFQQAAALKEDSDLTV